MAGSMTPRGAQRRQITLAATCRTLSGMRDECRIADISTRGCRLTSRGLVFRAGTRLTIRPNGIEGLTGTVRWADGYEVGIEFDAPLYAPVVEHLSALYAAGGEVAVSTV